MNRSLGRDDNLFSQYAELPSGGANRWRNAQSSDTGPRSNFSAFRRPIKRSRSEVKAFR